MEILAEIEEVAFFVNNIRFFFFTLIKSSASMIIDINKLNDNTEFCFCSEDCAHRSVNTLKYLCGSKIKNSNDIIFICVYIV